MRAACAVGRAAKPALVRVRAVRVSIVPEPSEPEREAILAALAAAGEEQSDGWAEAALAEAVEDGEPDP